MDVLIQQQNHNHGNALHGNLEEASHTFDYSHHQHKLSLQMCEMYFWEDQNSWYHEKSSPLYRMAVFLEQTWDHNLQRVCSLEKEAPHAEHIPF